MGLIGEECSICEKEIVRNNTEKFSGIPAKWYDTIICQECRSDGWDFCEYNKKPYDKSGVNSKEFKLVYELGLAQRHSVPELFCSNKCYNLHHIENEKNSLIQKKHLGSNELIKIPDRQESTTKYIDDRINYLDSLLTQISK